jgi:hypothetical protein
MEKCPQIYTFLKYCVPLRQKYKAEKVSMQLKGLVNKLVLQLNGFWYEISAVNLT